VESASEVLKTSIVIDALTGEATGFENMMAAGVTAANVTVGADDDFIIEKLKSLWEQFLLLDSYPDKLMLIENAADIRRCKEQGKMGIILGLQGMTPIGKKLSLISILRKLGISVMGLTYNETNDIACSCTDETDGGLTYYGREVIREMNRLGVLVDLSHTGPKSSLEAIELSSKPVALTHSNPRALCDHERNAPDEVLMAVAEKNGVICLTSYSIFCETTPGVRPKVEDYVDHLEYTIDLVGVEHVGLGTDMFEGKTQHSFQKVWVRYAHTFRPYSKLETRHAEGMENIAGIKTVAEELLRRGHSPDDVSAIFGGNFLRVYDEATSAYCAYGTWPVATGG
jgi:membrane dipeptidase